MWLEMIVGGKVVTFSQVGMHLDRFGNDQRCGWAAKIEAEAQKICGRREGVQFRCERGDLRIWLHEDAVKPVIRAIEEAEQEIPEDIRWFFQRISYLLAHGERYEILDLPGRKVG
ncbi:MAG: hypothetical protein JRN27_07715 [Nitrososphaerota archaeon]|nr:hypothetical protein [Nitrososphaerota archaeon]